MSLKIANSISNKLKEFFNHGLIYGLGSAANSAVGFLFIPLFTVYLSAEEYGVFALVSMIGTIAGSIFYLGVTSSLVRSYFDYQNIDERRTVFSTTFYMLLFGALLQIGLGYFFSSYLSVFLLGTDLYERLIFACLVSSALLFLNFAFLTYLRLERKSLTFILVVAAALVVNLFCSSYLLIVEDYGVWAPICGALFGQGMQAFYFTLFLAPKVLRFKLSINELKTQLSFGIPTVLTSFALMSIEWSDRIVIEKYSDLAAVGVYSLGYKVGAVLNVFLITPFIQVWNPMMMEYKNSPDISLLFTKIINIYAAMACFFSVTLLLFVDDIILYFAKDEAYLGSIYIINIISIGVIFYGLSNIFCAGLLYSRRVIVVTRIYYFAAFLNLGLNLVMVPRLGIVGAGLATMLTYICIPLLLFTASQRYFVIKLDFFRLGSVFVIAGSILLLGMSLEQLMETIFYNFLLVILLAALLLVIVMTGSEIRSLRNKLMPL